MAGSGKAHLRGADSALLHVEDLTVEEGELVTRVSYRHVKLGQRRRPFHQPGDIGAQHSAHLANRAPDLEQSCGRAVKNREVALEHSVETPHTAQKGANPWILPLHFLDRPFKREDDPDLPFEGSNLPPFSVDYCRFVDIRPSDDGAPRELRQGDRPPQRVPGLEASVLEGGQDRVEAVRGEAVHVVHEQHASAVRPGLAQAKDQRIIVTFPTHGWRDR